MRILTKQVYIVEMTEEEARIIKEVFGERSEKNARDAGNSYKVEAGIYETLHALLGE